MTKEKTIEILNALWRSKDCGYSEREIREALDFAIMHIKKEPCKDAMSRAEALKMCSVILIGGEIIGVDADDYLFNEKTRIIRLFKDNHEIAKFNIDKIAGVVRNYIKILER